MKKNYINYYNVIGIIKLKLFYFAFIALFLTTNTIVAQTTVNFNALTADTDQANPFNHIENLVTWTLTVSGNSPNIHTWGDGTVNFQTGPNGALGSAKASIARQDGADFNFKGIKLEAGPQDQYIRVNGKNGPDILYTQDFSLEWNGGAGPLTAIFSPTGWNGVDEIELIVYAATTGTGGYDNDMYLFIDNFQYTMNVIPAISNLNGDSGTFTEGGSALILDSLTNASVTDPDATGYNTGNVTASITGATANEDISISTAGSVSLSAGMTVGSTVSVSGTSIGTIATSGTGQNASDLIITLNTDATDARISTLLQNITYTNDSQNPLGTRTVGITVTDADGGASSTANVSVTLAGVNDEPTLTATGGSKTFTEGGSATDLFSTVTISTIESGQTIDSLVLTVTNVNDGSDEILFIDGSDVALTNGNTVSSTTTNGMKVAVAVSVTTATVTITKPGGITPTLMQTLVDGITYHNENDNPYTTNSRVVTLTTIRDNGGTANGGDATATLSVSATVSIVAVNDAPTLTSYSGVIDTTTQNTEVEITFAELLAKGNEADVDGTIDTFVVNTVSSGTLNIGVNSGAAAAFNASTNNKIDATNNAYWTPANDVFGTQNAFTTTVLDNNGAESSGAVQANVQVNDVINPEVSSISISGAHPATVTSVTFVVAFSEAVVNVSTDDFELTKTGTADGTIVSVSSAAGTSINIVVNSISGTGTLRLDLKTSTNIADASANTPPAAYSSGSVHTVDRDNPTLSLSNPVDDAIGVSPSANITLTFNENIVFGTGNIQIIDLDDANIITIDAASPGAQASISNTVLTLNPNSNLVDNHNYAIQIAATAIDDTTGNSYAGISDNTTLNFKIAPTVAFTSTSSNGLESVSSADLQVGLSSTSSYAITVEYAVTGTASGSGIDFTLANGTLTIAANAASDTITIATIVDDALFEDNETVIVTLSNPVNASLGTDTVHTYTITDNDSVTVSLSSSDATATEGGSDNGEFTATLTKVNNTGLTINIPVTMSGEATNGTDYTTITQIPILNGSATGTVAVAVTQDALFENTETVIATLGSLSGVNRVNAGAPNNATVTINDDGADAVTAGLTASDNAATEGGADDGQFTATLSSTNNTGSAINIPVTMSGQAIDGTDYASISQITVANGSATGTVVVDVTQDALFENTETVIATLGDLSGVTGVSAGTPTNDTVTISDDASDAVTVGLAATDDTAIEGGGDDGEFTATITKINNTGSAINIPLTMSGEATNGTDYTTITQISIANGSTSGTVSVEVTQDGLFENTETVIATLGDLSGVTGVSAGTPTKDTVTISDDASDAVTVGLSASDDSATEGGVDDGEFTVTLTSTNNTGSTITIPVTMSGEAIDGTDYASITQITVANGSATGTVIVDVADDIFFENTETVIATLGSLAGLTGVSAGTPTSDTVTINDDIADAAMVEISASDAVAAEGGSNDGEFTATLSKTNTTGSIIIIPLTMSGLATNGVDYTSVSQISIANGLTAGTVAVNVIEDALFEVTETVIASLGDLSGLPGVSEGIATTDTVSIDDDDIKPSVTFASALQSSSDESGTLTITAVLSAISGADVTVPYTVNGLSTATGGGVDYIISTSPLTIVQGNLSNSITITITEETDIEFDETVIVDMGIPTNATQGAITRHIATIPDDDGPPFAVDDFETTNEDTPFTFNPLYNDYDLNDNLDTTSVTILDSTNYGLLSLTQATGQIEYTPVLNYHGNDTLLYYISNLNGLKDTAMVSISVIPVNDAPVANNDSLSAWENTPATINVLDNDSDVDMDGLKVFITKQPESGGTVYVASNIITYRSPKDFSGDDVFEYQVCDNGLAPIKCATAKVFVKVNSVNALIVIDHEYIVLDEDAEFMGDLTDVGDYDPDGTELIATTGPVVSPANGVLKVLADGQYTYTPNPNFNGTDLAVVQICDQGTPVNTCKPDSIYITVNSINDAPEAIPLSITVTEDTTNVFIDISGNVFDVENNGLITGIISGSAVFNSTFEINYSPAANFNGTEVITYFVCDDMGACDTSFVNITVAPVNDPPVLLIDIEDISMDLFSIRTILLDSIFSDADDGDRHTYGITVNGGSLIPAWMVYDSATNTVSLTPSDDSNVGKYVIQVVATDLAGANISSTFTLTVNPVYSLSGSIFINHDGGAKSGLITQEGVNGEPAEDVLLVLMTNNLVYDSLRTDNAGQYVFDSLPAATYEVYVEYMDFVQDTVFQIVLDSDNQYAQGINFTIWPGKSLITNVDLPQQNIDTQIFPNPTRGIVNLRFGIKPTEKIVLSVYSYSGSQVLRKEYEPQKTVSFNLEEFVGGMYIVRLQTGNKLVVKEIILDKYNR